MGETSENDNPIWPTVIFIVLNLLFISLLFVGITKFTSGAAAYEEAYAKKIALLIDSARPGMTIELNFKKPLEVCRSNHCGEGGALVIRDGEVIVTLGSSKGYAFKFFKDYEFSDEDIIKNGDVWSIKIKDVK